MSADFLFLGFVVCMLLALVATASCAVFDVDLNALLEWNTPFQKSVRKRRKEISRRAAEFVDRGFSPDAALGMARQAIEKEAKETTEAFKKAGVEG